MIILRSFKSEFQDWDNLINEAKLKKIHCPDVSHVKFINSLKTIRRIAHKNLLSNPQFEDITVLLNQIRYYTVDRASEHFSFVHELYGISKLIKLIDRKPCGKKLFDADIFSNFGMFTQFLITAYIAKRLNIIDLEVKNPPLNTDILAKYGNRTIHFHVKDIRERNREERLDSAIYAIDNILSDRAKDRGAERRLSVSSFMGIPPEGLPTNYWENFARNIDEKSQTIKLNFPPKASAKNEDEIKITIAFKWKEYSGIFNAPKNTFNNWERLVAEYTKIDDRIKSTVTSDCHILVAVTEDKYDLRGIKKSIENDKMGVVLIEIIEFQYDRSPFIFPIEFDFVEEILNRKFPDSVEFIFK